VLAVASASAPAVVDTDAGALIAAATGLPREAAWRGILDAASDGKHAGLAAKVAKIGVVTGLHHCGVASMLLRLLFDKHWPQVSGSGLLQDAWEGFTPVIQDIVEVRQKFDIHTEKSPVTLDPLTPVALEKFVAALSVVVQLLKAAASVQTFASPGQNAARHLLCAVALCGAGPTNSAKAGNFFNALPRYLPAEAASVSAAPPLLLAGASRALLEDILRDKTRDADAGIARRSHSGGGDRGGRGGRVVATRGRPPPPEPPAAAVTASKPEAAPGPRRNGKRNGRK